MNLPAQNPVVGPERLTTPQKKILELQKKINFYERILHEVPASIYITDINRKMCWCNHAYEEATGYTFEELRLKNEPVNHELVHPEDMLISADKILHYRNFFGLGFGGIFRMKSRRRDAYKWYISHAIDFERDEEEQLEKIICVELDMNHNVQSHGQIVNALKQSLQVRNDHLATSLTQREKEILKLICSGISNRQISEKLFLSRHTIETHRKNIRRKLHTHNPAELALKARDIGLD